MSIHNMENLISNAFRRSICLNEKEVVPRMVDLNHLTSSMKGKIEWEFIETSEEEDMISLLVRDAVSKVFTNYFGNNAFTPFLQEFSTGNGLSVSEMTPSLSYLDIITPYPSLREKAEYLAEVCAPAQIVSAAEFILEGLAARGKIRKEVREAGTLYSSRQ